MLKDSLKMSWENIIHNKMRSFLTILGVVIGVTAIIALITIVQGMIDEVDRQFMSLGADKLLVQATGTPLKQGLNLKDLENLKAIPNVSSVTPGASAKLDISAGGKIAEDITVEGKNEASFQDGTSEIRIGRGINILDMENKNRVCVINQDLEQELFLGENPLGQKILINGISYQVIGVLAEKKNDMMALMMGGNSGGKLQVPYTAMVGMINMNHIYTVEIAMEDSDLSEETIELVKASLNQTFNYKDDSYSIIDMNSLLDTMKTMQNMMKNMLVGIASIALLVGGIGIMNMMLVSVTERTTEIGLRKALGAEPKQIQLQFLLEAIMLSMFGGLIGMILGIVISLIAAAAIGIEIAMSVGAIVIALSFSAAVGIIFGWTPARKASKLNPIDALRSV